MNCTSCIRKSICINTHRSIKDSIINYISFVNNLCTFNPLVLFFSSNFIFVSYIKCAIELEKMKQFLKIRNECRFIENWTRYRDNIIILASVLQLTCVSKELLHTKTEEKCNNFINGNVFEKMGRLCTLSQDRNFMKFCASIIYCYYRYKMNDLTI